LSLHPRGCLSDDFGIMTTETKQIIEFGFTAPQRPCRHCGYVMLWQNEEQRCSNDCLGSKFRILGVEMPCTSCWSANQRKFSAEINIHLDGHRNLDTPTVWLFPPLRVCLDCGFTEFEIPGTQLRELKSLDSGNAIRIGNAG